MVAAAADRKRISQRKKTHHPFGKMGCAGKKKLFSYPLNLGWKSQMGGRERKEKSSDLEKYTRKGRVFSSSKRIGKLSLRRLL